MKNMPLRCTVVVMIAALLASACADHRDQITSDPPIVVPPAPIAPSAWTQRGTLVGQPSVIDISALPHARQGIRATYRSVSAVTGQQTEVSGSFFVPKDNDLEHGSQIIALGHGTTGLASSCGLSTMSDLRGYAPLVDAMLRAGRAVAVTDYEGLGGRDDQGDHPFLEPRTAAFNLIDSVRALRVIVPSASARWLAYGVSQGGQTVWAANELNDWYGAGLDLAGVVALAPAADVTGFSELAFRHHLTAEQLMVAPMLVAGLARYDSSIDVSRYLRGDTARQLDQLVGCQPDAPQLRAEVIRPEDVGPINRTDADSLTTALRRIALPQHPLAVPMLVLNGSEDEAIFPLWVSTALSRSCALGGTIEHREVAGAGHGDLSPDGAVAQWIDERFAAQATSGNCAQHPRGDDNG
jgi:alpha-beta hydrolase superfamily lysophospholipase